MQGMLAVSSGFSSFVLHTCVIEMENSDLIFLRFIFINIFPSDCVEAMQTFRIGWRQERGLSTFHYQIRIKALQQSFAIG